MDDIAKKIMDREALARLDRPLDAARGLPPAAYIDPGFFACEQERLFRSGWQSVAFSHEIPNHGDALPVSVAGTEIIVVRDETGACRAFHNVCRHRASIVLHKPANGLRSFNCPYHAWAYNLDGSFRVAPFWDGSRRKTCDGFDRANAALMPIRCGEWHDVIFVNVSGSAAPLEDFVRPLAQIWSPFDLSELEVFDHGGDTIEANWKIVMEGLLEVYHEEFIHSALQTRVTADGAKLWVDTMLDDVMGFSSTMPDDVPDRPELALPRVPGMAEQGPTPTDVFLLFPATSMNVLADHVVRTIWTAVSPTETRWRSAWYFRPEALATEASREKCRQIVDFWKLVRGEDKEAVLAVQRGLRSVGPQPQETRFSPYWEEIIRHFQRRVARGVTAASN